MTFNDIRVIGPVCGTPRGIHVDIVVATQHTALSVYNISTGPQTKAGWTLIFASDHGPPIKLSTLPVEIEREINAVPFTVYGFDSTVSRRHDNECCNKIFKVGWKLTESVGSPES